MVIYNIIVMCDIMVICDIMVMCGILRRYGGNMVGDVL